MPVSMASREQGIGIGQANQAVTAMEKVTQKNAQMVDKAAPESKRMQEQAVKLAQLVSAFKLSARLAGVSANGEWDSPHVVPAEEAVAKGLADV